MNITSVFSARNLTLFAFILVVLFLGATFDTRVGHESFTEVASEVKKDDKKVSSEKSLTSMVGGVFGSGN